MRADRNNIGMEYAMEILILITITSAIGCGIIASNKGRSVVGHVILGLLFGFFGLLITALLSNKKAA